MTSDTVPASKGPTWKQAVILVGAGIVLSASGCGTWIYCGFVVGGATHDELVIIGAIAFFVGVAVFVVGMYRAWKMVTRSDELMWKLGLIPFGAGIALGAGGRVAIDEGRGVDLFGPWSGPGFAACVAGALLILFGAVLLLGRLVRAIRNAP